VRCGIPTATQTNLALWGKKYGKKLFLPDGIENIAAQTPQNVGATAERFINENTIYPTGFHFSAPVFTVLRQMRRA